jgi:feruloyl-CoA synthase
MSSAQDNSVQSPVPFREVQLPPVRMDRTEQADGSIVLRCSDPLQHFDPNIPRNFLETASRQSDKTLYAQRRREADGSLGDWVHTSFSMGAQAVKSIGQWLLDQGFGNRDTVLIISGNSSAHALMRLGTMAAGVTCCPISANYALLGGNYERLQYVIDLVRPKAIFSETGGPYDAALQACDLAGCRVISCVPESLSVDAVGWDSLLSTPAGDAIRTRIESADPDAEISELAQSPEVKTFLQRALQDYNMAYPASSKKIRRFSFMREAPSAARHELSDKGTLNQLIASENRSGEIDDLYAPEPDQRVLVL